MEIRCGCCNSRDRCDAAKGAILFHRCRICMKTADSPDLRGLFIAEPVDAPRTRTNAYLVRLSLSLSCPAFADWHESKVATLNGLVIAFRPTLGLRRIVHPPVTPSSKSFVETNFSLFSMEWNLKFLHQQNSEQIVTMVVLILNV